MILDKRQFLYASGAAIAALTLPKPAWAQEQETTIRYAISAIPNVIDPHFSTGVQIRDISYLVFDTLFAVDDNFKPQPQMVDTWTTSEDGMTYQFTLRDGLKWHDGTPVTAEDCVLSIKRWGTRDSTGTLLMEATKSLTVIDDKSFELVLGKPFAFVLESLGKPGSFVPAMMPKRLAETPATTPIPELVGSGPFRHSPEESLADRKLVFLKNEEYQPRSEPSVWMSGGKVVKVDRLEILEIPDATTQLNALLNGEIDYLERLSPDLLPLVKSSNGKAEIANISPVQLVVRLNHLQPPFDNLKVRQALLLAIDQEEIVRAVASDPEFGRTCRAVFGCELPYQTDTGAPTRNIEQARALIEESGVDLSKPLVQLLVANAPSLTPVGEVVAYTLQQLGFTIDQQVVDFPTFAQRRQNKGPVSEGGWNFANTTLGTTEAMNPLDAQTVISSGETAWWGWPEDARTEELRQEFAATSDADKRFELAQRIQERVYENVSYIPVGELLALSIKSSSLKGTVYAPATIFWNVEKVEG